jgi:hypothetical protein
MFESKISIQHGRAVARSGSEVGLLRALALYLGFGLYPNFLSPAAAGGKRDYASTLYNIVVALSMPGAVTAHP